MPAEVKLRSIVGPGARRCDDVADLPAVALPAVSSFNRVVRMFGNRTHPTTLAARTGPQPTAEVVRQFATRAHQSLLVSRSFTKRSPFDPWVHGKFWINIFPVRN